MLYYQPGCSFNAMDPVRLMTLLTNNHTGKENEVEERKIRIMKKPDIRYFLRPKQ